jgi:hypothetical protein
MNLRLTGARAELENTLNSLNQKGFRWTSNNKYYPQRGNSNECSYYLNDVQLPAPTETVALPPPPTTPGEPQPRPWDAVLGDMQLEQS